MAKMDKIADAKPIDLTASRITWQGQHFDSNKRLNQEIWTGGPPPTIDPPAREDLRGTRRDRMTIIGYITHKKLLGRCSCGNYEMRDAKAWRKGIKEQKVDPGCQYCRETDHLRRTDHFRRTGRDIDT